MFHSQMIQLVLCRLNNTLIIAMNIYEFLKEPKLSSKPRNRIIFLMTLVTTIYSAFVADNARGDCKVDFQFTGVLVRANKYPIVEQCLSKLPAKFESIYPTSKLNSLSCSNFKAISTIPRIYLYNVIHMRLCPNRIYLYDVIHMRLSPNIFLHLSY